ncbi:MAG: sugar ABC transporter ATP-binding protein [Rhizobiales bacterium]|nr:sugar ABC transporter ATP-binding protein [Hyphomicrobiales bacterium]
MAPDAQSPEFLRMDGISKSYAGVRALADVNFACRRGSIHAVLGENGAGKSTLIKIISGVVRPDSGTMTVEGTERAVVKPADAVKTGIVSVFQELSLMPDLTVAENISILDPPRRLGLIDKRRQNERAEALLARMRCEDVDPRTLVRDLSLSRRQMVEIAKALGKKPSLMILDEATSALTSRDVDIIYEILQQLRGEGVGMLFISHRMQEIEAICDTLSVFRNGQHIETFPHGARSQAEIVRLMIGRDIVHQFPPKPAPRKLPPHLEVEGLAWENRLRGVSLGVAKGEIVGLGGLDGQGQKELLLSLFGVLRGVAGTVKLAGKPAAAADPAAASGSPSHIALVPEDRKTEGLMLPMSIAHNLLAASFDKVRSGPFIDSRKAGRAVAEAIERFQIKLGAPSDPVATLSGGNQQKVVIAKWMMTEPKLVLLNDPTRGIDVGTKQELYRLMRDLADNDTAILLYSTDYAELIGLCDRVLVMYDGRIVREYSGTEVTEEKLVAAALNIAGGQSGSDRVEAPLREARVQ